MKLIGAGLGCERHYAAAGLSVLGFEAVRVHGEFGERFHGGSVQRRFVGVTGAVGANAVPVESSVPGGNLAAANR